jgi:signal transduction histidine kinase
MYHLVHNAIKFNREMGTVQVSCWATDSHLVFKVTDTGCGMSSEELAHIWEAFTQAADDVRRGVEGLGLGLALVKIVIEAHGGEVWATSQPGKGSTFGFRIPNLSTHELETV